MCRTEGRELHVKDNSTSNETKQNNQEKLLKHKNMLEKLGGSLRCQFPTGCPFQKNINSLCRR